MNGHDNLERSYRRLLACYPRSFRRDSEDEIFAVLLATAEEGQRRVRLAEAADLLRGALRMRLRPAVPRPRSVRAAVRLMCAGAVAEVAAVVTVLVTIGSVKAAVVARGPAEWHSVLVHLIVVEAAAPVAIGSWLWMAWANARGHDWARLLAVAFFSLVTMGLIGDLVQRGAVYAPADLIAGGAEWAVGLAALVLIFTAQSNRYYQPEPARQ
jgi:hypothetical protein